MNDTEETRSVCMECISEMLTKLPLEFVLRVYRLTEYLYEKDV